MIVIWDVSFARAACLIKRPVPLVPSLHLPRAFLCRLLQHGLRTVRSTGRGCVVGVSNPTRSRFSSRIYRVKISPQIRDLRLTLTFLVCEPDVDDSIGSPDRVCYARLRNSMARLSSCKPWMTIDPFDALFEYSSGHLSCSHSLTRITQRFHLHPVPARSSLLSHLSHHPQRTPLFLKPAASIT